VLKGFKEFIMRGNVVDLAVAVVIGAAFKSVVDAFVADIVTPIIAALGGQPDFSKLTFTIHKSKFLYGSFINAIISFVIIAAAIYFFVVLPLNKLAERRAARMAAGQPADDEPQAKPEDVVVLEQIRDLLMQQNGGSPTMTKTL
jgi:large conductance mechanosensitive channel